MPARSAFDYALIRVVPRVERGECINVGAILYCRTRGFLGMRLALDTRRLLALAPDVDLALVESHLAGMERICTGDPAAGPIAHLSQAERFHWLVSPSSTIIQPSAAHSGLTDDPEAALDELMDELVRVPEDAHQEEVEGTIDGGKGAAAMASRRLRQCR
jgi:hypothetical protein